MKPVLILVDSLADAAEETLRAVARLRPALLRPSRGATLRPGPDTPLWNELAKAVRPYLSKHGEQAKLGRILGVPRQRVHEYFVSCTACPDAERVMVVLYWLAARRAGRDLA